MSSYIYYLMNMNLDAEAVVASAKQKILSSAGMTTDTRNYQALEDYLNEVYYSATVGTAGEKIFNTINEEMENWYTNKLQEAAGAYDWEGNLDVEGKIATNEIDGLGKRGFHKTSIATQVLKNRLIAVKTQLEELQKKPDVARFSTIQKNLEQLQIEINTLLSKSSTAVAFSTNKYGDIINRIDELWQAVSYYDKLPVLPEESGEVFERILKLASVGASRQAAENINQLMREAFKEDTQGSQVVNRGFLSMTASLTSVREDSVSADGLSYSYTIGQGENSWKVNGTFSARQGKMDVLMDMPMYGGAFRVSAKNWNNITGRDFGETSLLSAILRTSSNADVAIGYGLSLGKAKRSGNSLIANHNYAKVCAVVDILMGYSQDTAFADTVIINDRTAGRIKVFSMHTLLSQIEGKLNELVVNGYNAGAIEADFFKMFNWKGQIGEQQYITRILSYMSSIMLSISSNVLSLYST